MQRNNKPAWWHCYLIWMLMVGLVLTDYWTPLPDGIHKLFALGIVVACGIWTSGWVTANREMLARKDDEHPGNGLEV